MKNRDELFFDYKLQHDLQTKLEAQPLSTRQQLKALRNCKRSIVPASGYKFVDVHRIRCGNKIRAGFANLYNCKSLWSCPTCAAFGLQKHRDKISSIIDHYHARGYDACMITYTIPHNKIQPLSTLLQILRRTYNGTQAARLLPSSAGSITSTEVTYNDVTGWHPHLHVLYFIPQARWHEILPAAEQIRQRWQNYLANYILKEEFRVNPNADTVHVSMNKKRVRRITSGDYIAKELAKIRLGKHRLKSRSPFELIESDDPRDFDRYVEYALATKGMTRVKYSRGLQKGVDFTAKKNSAFTEPVAEEVLCSFSESSWRLIIEDEIYGSRKRHRRRILLCACVGFDRVVQYCEANNLPPPLPPQRQILQRVVAAA